jgi:hypothetical protein
MPAEQEWERQLADLSEAVYDPNKKTTGDWTRLSDDELRAADIDPGRLINEDSGLKSDLYKNSKGEVVLAYAGTENWTDVWVDAKQALGFETDQYKQAAELAEKAIDAFGDKLSFTGHSLGGALATQAAAITGLLAVVYNPAGLHDNTLKRNGINPEAFKKLADTGLVKRVVVKGEVLDSVQEWGGKISPPPTFMDLKLRQPCRVVVEYTQNKLSKINPIKQECA